MRVTIRKKNLSLTPALSEYIKEKIVAPVEKLLQKSDTGLPILDVEVGRSTEHHRKGNVYVVRVTLQVGRRVTRVETEHEDIRAACDVMEEELRRAIIASYDKARTLYKRRARSLKKNLHLDPAARFRKGQRTLNEGN